jgi:hypothetical protein
MTAIRVGTTDLPTPSEISLGVMDISKAERNTRGMLLKEHIATKQKLELGWKYLSATELKTVLSAVSPTFFDVTYTDPLTNATRTGTFYAGDRTVGVMDIKNGVTRYKDIKFNLIER